MISDSQSPSKLHKNESIKSSSDYLRGTILEGLSDSLDGSLSADDQQLTKFHGIYQQDNRDIRAERRRKNWIKPIPLWLVFVCREVSARPNNG